MKDRLFFLFFFRNQSAKIYYHAAHPPPPPYTRVLIFMTGGTIMKKVAEGAAKATRTIFTPLKHKELLPFKIEVHYMGLCVYIRASRLPNVCLRTRREIPRNFGACVTQRWNFIKAR